jgi:hypothetical protein
VRRRTCWQKGFGGNQPGVKRRERKRQKRQFQIAHRNALSSPIPAVTRFY